MFSARPTAVNLGWAVDRIKKLVLDEESNNADLKMLVESIRKESLKIYDEDIEIIGYKRNRYSVFH